MQTLLFPVSLIRFYKRNRTCFPLTMNVPLLLTACEVISIHNNLIFYSHLTFSYPHIYT